eukprot:1194708-Prorocentrum_minimum.AAC.9
MPCLCGWMVRRWAAGGGTKGRVTMPAARITLFQDAHKTPLKIHFNPVASLNMNSNAFRISTYFHRGRQRRA